MKKFILASFLILCSVIVSAQTPTTFNYQSVIRNGDGELITNQNIGFRFSIIPGTALGDPVYTETQNNTSNNFGLCNVKIGEGTIVTGDITAIDWSTGACFLKVDIDISGGVNYVHVGTSELLSVPFSMYAKKADKAANIDNEVLYFSDSDTLFAVKDREGNIVFAVYPDGAQVYVNQNNKGRLGGFAVSGRGTTKGEQNYLSVTPDSTRIYVNESAKGILGGFAVSGRGTTKGVVNNYLQVTKDSTRIYIDESSKGILGGFAVSGRGTTKGDINDYFNISGSSTAEIIDPSEARILWYPKKEAFLVGKVLVESPDSVGTNSFVSGYESKAIGNYSQALGYSSIARGNYSTAIGRQTVASSKNALAIGDSAIASGVNAIAFGSSFIDFYFHNGEVGEVLNTAGPVASGDNSLAIGSGVVASADGAVVIGALDTASAEFTTVFGFRNKASAFAAVVGGGETNYATSKHSVISGGHSNYASGEYSTVGGGQANQATAKYSTVGCGIFNIASGDYSTVVGGRGNHATGSYGNILGGIYNEAHDYSETVFGQYNEVSTGNQTSWASTDKLFVVGNGTGFGSRSNAMVILKNGNTGIGRNPTANALEVEGTASKSSAGEWVINSDRRIKTDIQDIENSFETILKLRPIKYKYTAEWKAKHPSIVDKYYYNYIAQEFQEVFPESVKGSGEYLEGDSKEILQLDGHNAQIVTIKAVQELIKENQELKERIEKLEKVVNTLIEN
jgi:hypothetical protein